MSTKAQQRVAIAKDALKWIEAGALEPESGTYCQAQKNPTTGSNNGSGGGGGTQLRDVVLGKCHVCAIGALFLAKAVHYDKVTVRDFWSGNYWDTLKQHFSQAQLDLVEAFFEGWQDDLKYGIVGALAFRSRHQDDTERLTLILQNIINNRGTFRPKQLRAEANESSSSILTTSAVSIPGLGR